MATLKTKIEGISPSRKGNAVILKTSAGDVFLSKEQFAGMPEGCEHVNYEVKTSWFDNPGKEHPYAEGSRNIFDSYPLVSRSTLMRERAEIAQEFGLTLAM